MLRLHGYHSHDKQAIDLELTKLPLSVRSVDISEDDEKEIAFVARAFGRRVSIIWF